MSKFNKSSVALDIGTRYIKLVELKRQGGNIMLTKLGIKEVPVDLKLDRDKVISQLVSQLLSENNIRARSINISVSGQSVFVRFVKLLQIKEDRLKQTMKFEAQNQIPFPLNEVMWDWALLDKDKKTAKKAVIVAIKKNLIEDMISRLNAIKLFSEVIDVAPISVYNCMAFNDGHDEEKLGAIVDIGARATNFIIFNKGNIWIRSFPIAGDRLIEAKGQGTEELLTEIERSMEYYFTQSGEEPMSEKRLDELVLTGGGSASEDIETLFSNRFNIKPQVLDPFRKLSIAKDVFPRLGAEGIKNQFSTVVGTALRGMVDLKIEVNFLNELHSEKKTSLQKRVYSNLSMATGALLLISLSIFIRQDYFIKKTKLNRIDEMLEIYRTYEPRIKKAQEEEAVLNEKMAVLYQVASSRGVWLDIFKSISEILPSDVWLTDVSNVLSIEKGELGRMDLDGRALSYQSVNNFVSGLKALPGLKDVKPISSSIENDKVTGEEIIRFSITMDVVLAGS